MTYWRTTGVVLAVLAAALATGCVRTSPGVPVAEPSGTAVPTSVALPTASSQPNEPPPGIMPTLQVPIPAGTVTCPAEQKPPVSAVAKTDDAASPSVTVGVPDGWSFTKGSGAYGLRMTGPDDMSAFVTIAATTDDPETAFRQYVDAIMNDSAMSSVSILPGEFCEYSGQKLMGARSDSPEDSIEFYDRLLHVWTNTANYFIAVHVEAPTGVPGLDAASRVVTDGLEITIP